MTTPRHLQTQSLFSPSRQNRQKVLQAIKKAFPDSTAVPELKLLAGGNSGNPVYKVTLGEIECVARVTNGDDKSKSDHLVSRKPGEVGIAPKVIYPNEMNIQNPVMLTEFIEGKALTPANAKDHEVAMLRIVKGIHSIPITEDMPASFSLFEAIKRFSGQFDIDHKDSLLQKVEDLETLLRNDTAAKATFVHNDINVNNCKQDANGEIRVFDWGDGGIGDPLEDLAHFTNLFGYNSDESRQILKDYLGRDATEVESAHFHLLKDISVLRTAIATASYACKASNTSHFVPDKNADPFSDWYEGYKTGKNKPEKAEGLHKVASAAFKTWELNQDKIDQYATILKANQKSEFVLRK